VTTVLHLLAVRSGTHAGHIGPRAARTAADMSCQRCEQFWIVTDSSTQGEDWFRYPVVPPGHTPTKPADMNADARPLGARWTVRDTVDQDPVVLLSSILQIENVASNLQPHLLPGLGYEAVSDLIRDGNERATFRQYG
jgi:hypothetical protein